MSLPRGARILDPPMQTRTETGAPHRTLPGVTWVAAALAAAASLLHWITTGTVTHSWSGDAVVSLVAGAALMALAITLAAGPWGPRTTRTLYLVGAVGTAVVVMAVLLPVLSEVTSGHAGGAGHTGHDVGGGDGGDGIVSAGVVRTAVELILVAVLVWMHRLTAPDEAELSRAPG